MVTLPYDVDTLGSANEFDFLQKIVDSNTRAINDVTSILNMHSSKLDDIKQTLALHTTNFTQMQNQITQLDGNVARMQNQITQLDGNVARMQTQIAQLDGNVAQIVLIIFIAFALLFALMFALLFASTTKRICTRLENIENIIFKNSNSYEKGMKLFVPKDSEEQSMNSITIPKNEI
ncbi:hypothetical protein M9Y10_032210 [Tritrichomonas musculus]|uniref:t-SNARE coiled-coil homology domain-containing protein n=1 Tax=Tritrichomonas musculus TaxID=1915356 RepID=A0ABR2GZA3_9EUKA